MTQKNRRNVSAGFSADADEKERMTRGEMRRRMLDRQQQEAEATAEPMHVPVQAAPAAAPVAAAPAVVVTEPTSVVKAGEAAVFQRIESGTQREKLAHYERTIGEAHSFVQAQLQAAHEHWVLAAGQSLQEIRDGQLYKSGYSSFEAYVQDRWKMQRAHAYRLISAVPVVRALVGVTRTELKERQMRALVPVAQQHGEHAVREVWEEAERRQRTSGAGLEEVRKFLGFDVDGAEEGGEPEQAPQRSVASVAILQRAWKQLDADTFRSAAQENPTEARRIVSELRELLDTVEKDMKG